MASPAVRSPNPSVMILQSNRFRTDVLRMSNLWLPDLLILTLVGTYPVAPRPQLPSCIAHTRLRLVHPAADRAWEFRESCTVVDSS